MRGEGVQASSDEMVRRALELLALPGPSGDERQVAAYLRRRLLASGLPARFMRFDNAHRRIPLPTRTGNLIMR